MGENQANKFDAAKAAEAASQARIDAANEAAARAYAEYQARIGATVKFEDEANKIDGSGDSIQVDDAEFDLEVATDTYNGASNLRRATMAALKEYESDNPVADPRDRAQDKKWAELADAANRAVNQKEAATAELAAAKDAVNPDL